KAIAKVQTQDATISKLQDDIIGGLQPILKNALVDGSLLTNVSLQSGQNTIFHGLGRTLQGWILVRERANANVWDNQDQNGLQNSTLLLNASAAVTVDVYVF